MGDDEAATVRTLSTCRDLVAKVIADHHGRVVDMPGDNILAEFASAVNAVEAAVAMQAQLVACNAGLPEDRRMGFRVGVNLGDVIEEGGRVYGDGVNIAARLEALAETGGICVSAKVYEEVGRKLELGFHDLGEIELHNIESRVRVYRVARPGESAPAQAPAAPPSAKPAIIVLPFSNMSGDAEQEFFTDGLTEDILTDLSRFHELFVISRNTSFKYKGQAVDVRKVAKELGVQQMVNAWCADPISMRQTIERELEIALALDENDSDVQRVLAALRLLQRNHDKAQFHQQRALSLNPNDDLIVVQHGEILTWVGEPEPGIPWIQKAMRLNPFHPPRFWNHLGRAYFVARRYGEAVEAFKRIAAPDQFHHAFLAACHAQLGDAAASARHAAEVLGLEPPFTLPGTLEPVLYYQHDRDLAHHRDGIQKAGLPV